ncbi:RNA 3'-terminal phosphate cyclase [Cytospora mali]|uniref:RNA 3'-terminal phosphate cyclase n=1 Tax=Cytospora mali TaxID=578113 RepID=A0A194VB09_CYTMA|nr:RNA 3'-terminal phosphate cyclase [Valsa mali var. pyri (nom. inval.)]
MAPGNVIELDGRTGEGGGQLVRIAVALAAVASKPVKVTNVRGNRPGNRGGGLKSQHVTSIEWLATATKADVTGLEVGSKTLEFRPNSVPSDLVERNVKIRAASAAASSLLIFQAVFPFLLFAGNASNEPIELTISGGTNVSFSLSYEYLDQVLLPSLEGWFGIAVERKLLERGWSSGPASRGSVWFKFQPLPSGDKLRLEGGILELGTQMSDFDVNSVDATVVSPTGLHAGLETALQNDLQRRFPGVAVNFRQHEESNHESRIYVLLVAKSTTLRWGRDNLYAGKRKGKTEKDLCEEVSRKVTRELYEEVKTGGLVDEHLQDQLVIFQALAEGKTSFPRSKPVGLRSMDDRAKAANQIEKAMEELSIGEQLRKDNARRPFGDPETDSSHTQTARWVTAEVLDSTVTWFNKGRVCEGIGLVSGVRKPSE